LTTASLFGKLREHELERNRLNEQEREENHVKGIAWQDNDDSSSSSPIKSDEEVNLA